MPGAINHQILLICLLLRNPAKKTSFCFLGIADIAYAPGSPESVHIIINNQ